MDNTRRLQDVLLMMIKDIDAICKENQITYYLYGGSALGAIRHKGFIPWDDDLDIILDSENYAKFIKVFKNLKTGKYWLQEGEVDWPMHFSKVVLLGTELIEYEGYDSGEGKNGIYVDVFKMENVSGTSIAAHWQYFWGKVLLCYQLSCRGFENTSIRNKILLGFARILKFKPLYRFVRNQISVKSIDSENTGVFCTRYKWRGSVIPRKYFGTPKYVPFEDTMLPAPEDCHSYLSHMYGDYMKLPPVENRVGLHTIRIDYGKYSE